MLQLLEVKKKTKSVFLRQCKAVAYSLHLFSSQKSFCIFCVVKPLHAMSVIAGPMLSATATQLQSWGLEGPPAVVLGN